jgi:hypothetical protein
VPEGVKEVVKMGKNHTFIHELDTLFEIYYGKLEKPIASLLSGKLSETRIRIKTK